MEFYLKNYDIPCPQISGRGYCKRNGRRYTYQLADNMYSMTAARYGQQEIHYDPEFNEALAEIRMKFGKMLMKVECC